MNLLHDAFNAFTFGIIFAGFMLVMKRLDAIVRRLDSIIALLRNEEDEEIEDEEN